MALEKNNSEVLLQPQVEYEQLQLPLISAEQEAQFEFGKVREADDARIGDLNDASRHDFGEASPQIGTAVVSSTSLKSSYSQPNEAALAFYDPDLEGDDSSTTNRWSRFSRPFRLHLTLEGALYGLIILLAVFTRIWDLDQRALHHDEGVHAYYSFRLYMGAGYEQEPWKHGPLLYHVTALYFWLFGASDLTARLPAASLGVVIALLPLLLRRELGRWGALTASFLLVISPTFLYFSRFIREDIFMAFATLLFFAGFVRFLQQPSARWWYIAMAGFGLLFCTKEASYFYMALFGGFVFLWVCWQFAPRLVLIFSGYLLLAAFTFFFVAGFYPPPRIPFDQFGGQALASYLGELVAHPIFYITLILISAGAALAWFAFKEAAISRRDFLVNTGRAAPGISPAKTFFLPYQEGTPAYAVGWLVRHLNITGTGIVLFLAIYSVLFTGFFTSPAQGEVGVLSGLWYWMAQQGVARGSQPWYYYFLMLPLYEPLALLFGTAAAVLTIYRFARYSLYRPLRRVFVPATEASADAGTIRTASSRNARIDDEELDELEPLTNPTAGYEKPGLDPALYSNEAVPVKTTAKNQEWVELAVPVHQSGNSLWPGKIRREPHPYFVPLLIAAWAFGGLAFYTWASEKMPWLTIQIILPFILLSGYFFQPVWSGLERYLSGKLSDEPVFKKFSGRGAFWTMAGGLVVIFLLAYMIGLYLTPSALKINQGGAQFNWVIIWIPPLLALLLWGVGGLLLQGRLTLYLTLAVAFCMLSLFLVKTGFGYAFYAGDIPVEMGIYTQTAPDLQRTVKELNNLTTMVPDMKCTPVLYDDDMRTPLDFYLRNYQSALKTADFKQGVLTSGEFNREINCPAQLKFANKQPITNLGDFPIIIMTDDKRQSLDDAQKRLLDTNYMSRHRVFRWWFAEEPYRNLGQVQNVEMDFLQDKPSKISLKGQDGGAVVQQGEVLTAAKLKEVAAAPGNLLDKLYSGNGGSAALLNLSQTINSTLNLGNPTDFSRLWRFVFYREQVQPLGHLDFTLYIRNDLAGLYRQYADLVPYPISQP